MTTKYTYSKTSDTANGYVDILALGQQIQSLELSGVYLGINIINDDIEILFNQALTAGEQTQLDSVVSTHDGQAIQGLGTNKNTRNPNVNDDTTKGFRVGSHWYNTQALSAWICLDASQGAAIWKEISTSYIGDLGDQLTSHLEDENNPHSVNLNDIGPFNLANLNANINDANLDDSDSPRTPTSHSTSHEADGSDEIDGDKLDIDFVPQNYVPNTEPSEVDSSNHLTAHLKGIDELINQSDVTGPENSTDNAVVRFDGTGGKQIQDSTVTIDDAGNLSVPGTVNGRDISADGTNLDTHIADNSNPHGITLATLEHCTLSELNALIDNANLDDLSESRTPTSHSTSHEADGSDELVLQNLSSGGASSGEHPVADGAGGWNLVPVSQYQLNSEKGQANGYASLDGSAEIADVTHGARGGGSLHTTATDSANGFMSAADKAKLDGIADNAEVDNKDAKVSSNDTSPGFLSTKLVAGANITLTEQNDGGNETLEISAASGGGGSVITQSAATNEISTGSESFVSMPDMSQTPGAGNFKIEFSSTIWNTSNDGSIYIAIFVDGSKIAHSERMQRLDAAYYQGVGNIQTQAYVTVSADQVVEIRWKKGPFGTAYANNRSMILTKV